MSRLIMKYGDRPKMNYSNLGGAYHPEDYDLWFLKVLVENAKYKILNIQDMKWLMIVLVTLIFVGNMFSLTMKIDLEKQFTK